MVLKYIFSNAYTLFGYEIISFHHQKALKARNGFCMYPLTPSKMTLNTRCTTLTKKEGRESGEKNRTKCARVGHGIKPVTLSVLGKRPQRDAMVLVATSQTFPAYR